MAEQGPASMHSGQTTLGLDASPSACSSAAVSDWPEPGLGVGGGGRVALLQGSSERVQGAGNPLIPSSSLGPSPPASTCLLLMAWRTWGLLGGLSTGAPGAILPTVAEPEMPDDCLGGNDDSPASLPPGD